MKKLLVVTDNYLPNFTGVTKVLNEVLPRLKDFEVKLIYPSDRNYKLHGIETQFVPFYFKLWGMPLAKVDEKIKEEVDKADIIWIQFISLLAIQAIWRAKKKNKTIVAYLHLFEDEVYAENANLLLRPLRFLVRSIATYYYNKCDLLIVPSQNVGNKARELGIKTKQIVVPLGVNITKRIKKYGESGKEKIILGFVGRISREKDLDTLIKAYNILKNKYKLELFIVGGGRKEEVNRIRNLSDNDVKIIGFVDKPEEYYNKFDIFIAPSLTETTSLVTLEAMSHGLPVITTRVGYVEKYIKDKENGLFFEAQDEEDLASKLEILIKNKELGKKLGKNAVKTATSFSWEKTAAEISKVFYKIVSKNK